MNKKLFFGLFAATGMLFATSCSDDELQSIQSGNEAQVSFALGLEGGIASRAISDGMSVDKLVYAVYDADNKLITTIAGSNNGQFVKDNAFQNGLTENVNITLAKGQSYTVVFWAQDESCNAYTVTTEADGIKVAVDYNGQNNDETRDAFFKAETFKVSGNAQINVTLKRPFAQVNVGVTKADWDAAVASGIDVEKSKVVIKNAATGINLLDGTVTGETAVDYYLSTIPAKFDTEEVLTVDVDGDGTISEDENYKYLSMSYILTAAEKTTLESLVFTFDPINGENIEFKDGLTSVPVQRNWRTNILGKLLTGDIEFNIVINPIYDGEYNNGEAKPVSINGVYYATIQDAINNAKAGDVISVATGTYPEVLDVKGGKNLTIEAAGPNVVVAALNHATNGTNNKSTIIVKGITFDNSETPQGWFTGTGKNLSPCVGIFGGDLTFNDCNFIISGESKAETGIATWYVVENNQANLTFNNCTFEAKGSKEAFAIQIYDYVNLTTNNCTFKTGYSEKVNNVPTKVAVKYVGEQNLTATFNNSIVEGVDYFVLSGSSAYPGSNYTININNATLGEGVEGAHIKANEEGQTVNIDGIVNVIAEGLILNENNQYVALNDAGLNNAIQGGQTTIYLEAGSFIIPDAAQRKTLKFIGTGNPNDTKIATQDDGSYEGCDYSLDGATVTFENISINTDSRTYTGYARCNGTYINCVINGTYTLYGKSTFERCTFNVTGDVYNIWTWGAKEATFDKCTFNCDGKSLLVYNQNLDITLNSCTFNDNGNISGKAAIETGVDNGNTKYTIKINDTKVNGFDVTGQNAVTYGGTNLGTNVWGNKNLITAENLEVIIDGVTVY